jgi:mRNA interferase HicA
MKCSELYRLLIKDGWYPVSQKGSHVKMKHDIKPGTLIFPNHGSQEVGNGLKKKLLKEAGIYLTN